MTSPAAAVCPAGPAPLSPPPWAAQPCSALPWHWLPAPALANPIPAAQRHGGLSLAWVYFVVPVLAVCFFRWGHLALCILICPLQISMAELRCIGRVTGFSLRIPESGFCVGVEAGSLLQCSGMMLQTLLFPEFSMWRSHITISKARSLCS